VTRLRKIGDREDALAPRTASVKRTGRALSDPFLAEQLADREFGHWTASAQVLNLLEREIDERTPKRILEFGGGLSTACLARYAFMRTGPEPEHRIVSIDESAEFSEETRGLLAGLGLESVAALYHAPLEEQRVGGRETTTYALPTSAIADLEQVPPDFVFVDGPSQMAERYGRYAALVLALPYLADGCRFYLDDALRDSELEYAKLWSEYPGIQIRGIAFAGHGLLFGRYEAT
jgi:predicted O-methyltransferase YrrM